MSSARKATNPPTYEWALPVQAGPRPTSVPLRPPVYTTPLPTFLHQPNALHSEDLSSALLYRNPSHPFSQQVLRRSSFSTPTLAPSPMLRSPSDRPPTSAYSRENMANKTTRNSSAGRIVTSLQHLRLEPVIEEQSESRSSGDRVVHSTDAARHDRGNAVQSGYNRLRVTEMGTTGGGDNNKADIDKSSRRGGRSATLNAHISSGNTRFISAWDVLPFMTLPYGFIDIVDRLELQNISQWTQLVRAGVCLTGIIEDLFHRRQGQRPLQTVSLQCCSPEEWVSKWLLLQPTRRRPDSICPATGPECLHYPITGSADWPSIWRNARSVVFSVLFGLKYCSPHSPSPGKTSMSEDVWMSWTQDVSWVLSELTRMATLEEDGIMSLIRNTMVEDPILVAQSPQQLHQPYHMLVPMEQESRNAASRSMEIPPKHGLDQPEECEQPKRQRVRYDSPPAASQEFSQSQAASRPTADPREENFAGPSSVVITSKRKLDNPEESQQFKRPRLITPGMNVFTLDMEPYSQETSDQESSTSYCSAGSGGAYTTM